ncbi:MAG: DHA2 family efflux MFS transporter permease subunit [Simkaniaceae bacterium]|nr:DHA2 family efflux MFS transporter permease subunit [Simkaniaceae bacterium]
MMVLDYSIANVCIPYIAGDLGVSNNQGTWVITSFSVGNAIALPLTGWMTHRFGQIRIMVGATLLFTLTSFLCGAAPNLQILVMLRFLQGYFAGPLIALSQSLLQSIYPKEKKNLALAFWNIVALVGPILGPIIGGWIVMDYTWPWIFYINIPVGIFSAGTIYILMRDQESEIIKNPIDYVGMLLLATTVTCLQIILDKGEQLDWWRSDIIMGLAVTAVLSMIYFIVWEKDEKHPIVDFRLFKDRNFFLSTMMCCISYTLIIGTIVITPLWLQNNMGYLAYNAGLAVSTMGIAPFFLMIGLPYLLKKTRASYLVALAYLFFAIAFFVFADFTSAASFAYIASTRMLLGLGLLFWITPLVSIAMNDVPQEKLNSASGLFHFFRLFMGGVGASLFTTYWERRSILHHHNQIEYINDYSVRIRSFEEYLRSLNFSGDQPLAVLNAMVDHEASLLAINDLHWISGWVCVVFFFACFLFKKGKKTHIPVIPSE